MSEGGAQLDPSHTSRDNDELLRILVVDDFSPFREALCSFLLGYEPLTVIGEAADGDEAIEMAVRLVPHVIIMDVKMPRTNGIEATQRIKQTLPDPCDWSLDSKRHVSQSLHDSRRLFHLRHQRLRPYAS